MSNFSQSESSGRSQTISRINLALVALLVLAGAANLWPQWQHNADLSHGWFTPLIFLLLIHEARTRGTQRFLPAKPATFVAFGLTLLAGLALLMTGGLYMAALERTHALVAAVLTMSLCVLLGAVWICSALGTVRLVPFNWIAGVAIFLWLLSSPLPPGTYANLTQGLQAWVTDTVLALLHLLGIAAVKHGNIIELPHVAVGVEEACSGVRSLLSCLYAGFFFSAAMVRTPWSRLVVIGLSAPLAFGMNVVRSLTLTLLAHNGIEISGTWHDVTGFAILGVTAVVLAGLALLLNRGALPSPAGIQPEAASDTASVRPASTRWAQAGLMAGLLLAVGLTGFFVANSGTSRRSTQPIPDLTAILPAEFAGWKIIPTEDLQRYAPQLQTDHLFQRTYEKPTPSGPLQITFYFAYWAAGQAPVSLVASHTPDACWPGSGWTSCPTPQVPMPFAIGARELPEPQYRVFEYNGIKENVWYWHLYDGRPIQTGEVRSPRRLLQLAMRYGFRRDGEQLFVRISSNLPWETIGAEPLTKEIFAHLERFGLQ